MQKSSMCIDHEIRRYSAPSKRNEHNTEQHHPSDVNDSVMLSTPERDMPGSYVSNCSQVRMRPNPVLLVSCGCWVQPTCKNESVGTQHLKLKAQVEHNRRSTTQE